MNSKDTSQVFISGFATACGMGTDSAGNIYVADSVANSVRVFSPAGASVQSFTSSFPTRVRVNRKTGEIYVLSRTRLTKHSALPAADFLYSVTLTSAVNMDVDASAAQSRIWVITNPSEVWKAVCYRDNGAALAVIAGRSINARGTPFQGESINEGGFNHLSVNPDETWAVFGGLWSTAKVNLTTGAVTSATHGNESAYGPDGKLYAYGQRPGGSGSYNQDSVISVYNTSGALIKTIMGQRNNFISGVTTRGIAVSLNGDIYVPQITNRRAGTGYEDPMGIDVYTKDGVLKTDNLFSNAAMFYPYGGIQVDPAGNTYLYASARPRGVIYPDIFSGLFPDPESQSMNCYHWQFGRQNYYLGAIGTIIKFPPTGGYIRHTKNDITGVPVDNCDGYNVPSLQVGPFRNKTYEIGGNPIWQYHGMFISGTLEEGECECTSGRFHVDLFGRVIVPEALQFEVSMLDNNKNPMLRFGDYGNPDQLGAGSARPDPAIPLCYPTLVCCVNRSIYVRDLIRIVKVKLSYPVEWSRNSGLVTGSEKLVSALGRNSVAVYPVPANPKVTVAVRLEKAGPVEVTIYTLTGRLVKDFGRSFMPAGVHAFQWGPAARGRTFAGSGIYIARIKMDGKVFSRNILVLN
jgi:hypothetical protein